MKVKTTTIRGKDEEDASLFISGPTGIEDGLLGSDGESPDYDERAHNNLINDISHIIKKKKMAAAPRSVRMSNKEGGTTIDTTDILKKLGIPKLDNLEALPTPIEKIVAQRAKRTIGYDNVACEAQKWGGLVHRRRVQDQLVFPLQKADIRVHTSLKTKEIQMNTPLEREVYSLLQGAKLMTDIKETNEEVAKKRAMSLEELKEGNRLLWRQKEQRRRMERKLWMQNKNKSRTFHRLLRKDRLKKQKAEFEELEKNDPEAAMEKLEELEKVRAEERMTLRHKKSKWAHLQGMRATRDEKAMAALQQNQNLFQELTAKRKMEESSSDEEEDNIEEKLEALRQEKQSAIEAGLFDPDNPWTSNLYRHIPERAAVTPESAIDDSFVNFKKFWNEVNRRKLIEKKALAAIAKRESEREEEEEGSEVSDEEGEEEGSEVSDEEGEEEDKMENDENKNEDEKLLVGETLKKTKKMKRKAVVESVKDNKAQALLGKKKKGKKLTGKEKALKEDKQSNPDEDVIKKTKKKIKGKQVDGEDVMKTKKKIKGKKVEGEDVMKTKKKIKGEKVDGEDVMKTKKKIKGKKVNRALKESEEGKLETQGTTKRVQKKVIGSKIKKQKASNQKVTENAKKKKAKKAKQEDIQNLCDDIEDMKTKSKKVGVSGAKKAKCKDESDKGKKTKTKEKDMAKKTPKKNAKSGKVEEIVMETQEADEVDIEEHLISIDNLFSQAELGLQKKLKKKLKKLGINTSDKTEWTKVKSRKNKKREVKSILPKIEEFDFTGKDDGAHTDERMDRVKTLEDMDALQERSDPKDELQMAVEALRKGAGGTAADSEAKKKPAGKIAQIDPSKFLQVDSKVLQAAMPDTITKGMEGLDDDEEEDDAEDVIRQAFAEDYLVDEFQAEKDAAIEKDKPKNLSLAMPGWGDWTGPNIKMSRKKIKRFTICAPPPAPRRDATLGNVIYNEKADVHDNLRKKMVSELPYPFSRVQDFEASVRAPVGRMFVPEKQHKKLTAPPVVTKPGTIIEPMTEEELLKSDKFNRKSNNKKRKGGPQEKQGSRNTRKRQN